ncbi:MAG: S41 family peptidase [Chthoniobacterales bacterium]
MKLLFSLLFLGLTGWLAAEDIRPVIDQLTPAEVKSTWEKLNSLISKSGGIDPAELERARLQGVLQKLGRNARLTAREGSGEIAIGVNFKEEILPRSILYARLGDLSEDNISQLADSLRKAPKTPATILDLRATRGSAGYEQAAQAIGLFTGGGKSLFSLVGSGSNTGKNFAGQGEALFNGILVVLVNEDTNGPAEVVAAALRQQAHALIVGKKTKGEALEFTSLLVNDRVNLEIAVGRIVLPGLPGDFLQNGVAPDLAVSADLNEEREILTRSEKEGIASFIFEIERPHMNEASLVAGRNPELDNYQARKAEKAGRQPSDPTPLLDRTLQRALDTATSLLILREPGRTDS